MCQNICECLKINRQKVWLLSYVIVDGFRCLSNGAKIHVLMLWIFKEKVCFTEAHYFIKSGKFEKTVFNSFMGLLKNVFVFFRVQNLEKIVFFQTSFSIT